MVAFTAGAVLTAANLNTAFNALTLRTVTGTSDTLVLADNGGGVTYSNASATTSTIPPNASVAFAVGTKIVLINLGAGVVTVTAGAGVTVNGATLTLAQNAGGTCIKTATNTWSFLPFSSGVGAANFSDTATGSYTGFKYLTFSASGTINISTAGFADLLVVGGGGGGGCNASGGGGGGSTYLQTSVYLPAGTVTVTVGAGGARADGTAGSNAQSGSPSVVGPYYGVGGGGAGGSSQTNPGNGQNGASGGGGGKSSGTAGSPVSGLGFAGGVGSSGGAGGGGGGGGAVGTVGSGTTGGNGGNGGTTTIAGTTPTGAYVAGTFTYAGGGAGAGIGAVGTAGTGGGGAASVSGNGTAGSANTGGGGGGSGATGSAVGGNGGSGIVIVRVAV